LVGTKKGSSGQKIRAAITRIGIMAIHVPVQISAQGSKPSWIGFDAAPTFRAP